MSDMKKKLIAAALATVMALTASLVQADLVTAAYVKLVLWLSAALGIVNTTFMPALLGEASQKSLADSAAEVAEDAKKLPLVLLLGLSLTGCSYWHGVKASEQLYKDTVTEWERWDAGHKRDLIRSACPARPDGTRDTDCAKAAIAPYVAKREAVLAAIETTGPTFKEANAVVGADAKDKRDALVTAIKDALARVLSAIASAKKGN